MSDTPFFQASHLDKSYPGIRVLKDVNVSAAAGETVAVIGPNGAGKTTLFKTLSGELFPNKGTVVFEGRDISTTPAWRRVRLGIGRSFQVARIFPELTVFDNVVVAIEALLRNSGQPVSRLLAFRPSRQVGELVNEALQEVELYGRRDFVAKHLAHGDKKRLELAMSLALQPKVIMLDEPTAGMSPSDRRASIDLLLALRKRRNITLMLTEHDMDVVFGLADRIVVLNYGEVIAAGTVAEVRANPLVREVYLGSVGHNA
jgi:branched-chain amino acid transport system ATP-binding protein